LGLLLGEHVSFFTRYAQELMGFTAGIFLHVSTTIIFESEQHHRLNFQKLISVVLGFIIAYTSTVI
ncbi:MAG: ZIP family metal transporter, partial [Schleiferiaceae bacterium]|nr:ZIP family metal transporter [Schleiferiaceae bacterium]